MTFFCYALLKKEPDKPEFRERNTKGGASVKTPILETKRLLLRPMTVNDAENAFTNWTGDPDVAKFMRWELHKNISETREWLASEEAFVESNMINWGFVLKETEKLIGSGGLVFIESMGMYELGYNIMKKYWNHGLATEASQKIIEFGKNELMQKRFYCCHAQGNPASGKVLAKIGFQYQNDGIYYSWDQKRKFESKEYLLAIR